MSEVFTEPINGAAMQGYDEEATTLKRQMILPNRHTDPFATREGKTLVWTGINMTLVSTTSLIDEFFRTKDLVGLIRLIDVSHSMFFPKKKSGSKGK